jgi:hypothetical protein
LKESKFQPFTKTLSKNLPKLFFIFKKTSKDDQVKKLNDYKSYIEFELKLVKDMENRTVPASSKNKAKSQKIDDENTSVNQLENEELRSHRLRLKCLFERAISDNSNCLDESLWLKYIYYLVSFVLFSLIKMFYFKLKSFIKIKKNEEESILPNIVDNRDFHLKVAKRSTRNCPWSSKLWINYALILEKANSTTEIIKSITI